MAEPKMVTFTLRNGEQRVYQDVTRVDDSRRHLVLVYSNNVLVAQLNKHDVVKFAFTQPAPAPDETAETDAAATEAAP
jgi:hypothetical protein